MNGSLTKSLREMRGISIYVFVFMGLLSVLAVFSKSNSTLGIITIMGAVIPASSIERENQKGFDTFERMLPVSPEQVVSSKYLLTLFTTLMIFVCSVLGHIAGVLICKGADGRFALPKPDEVSIADSDFFIKICFISLITIAVAGLLIVIFYRFKSSTFIRMIPAAVCLTIGIGCGLMMNDDEDSFIGPLSEISAVVLITAFVVCTVIFAASYVLSLKFYNKYKD